jgi:glutaminyl-tRNA synthetase
VRLKFAFYIKCNEVVKDERGEITEVRCTCDPDTRGGWSKDGRKVKGTIHWVSAEHALTAEVRLYENLFSVPEPENEKDGADYKSFLNPNSLKVLKNCLIEHSLKGAVPGDRFQFERLGYFCVDNDSTPDKLIFNRSVTLRDTWAKIEKSG